MDPNLKFLYYLILKGGWKVIDQSVSSNGQICLELILNGYYGNNIGNRIIKLPTIRNAHGLV